MFAFVTLCVQIQCLSMYNLPRGKTVSMAADDEGDGGNGQSQKEDVLL